MHQVWVVQGQSGTVLAGVCCLERGRQKAVSPTLPVVLQPRLSLLA